MSLHQHYQLKLVFSGPFITQASGTLTLGMDVEMQKDSANQPVINGSLIKGNIRHTLNDFSTLLEDECLKADINRWFGSETSDHQYTPQRTHIDFDFFWQLASDYETSQQQRTRIAIDSATGTVNEGALQIAEDCFPLNCKKPIFAGKIIIRFKNETERLKIEKWLNKALAYIPAMGSFKGVGWGKLVSATLEPIQSSSPTPSNKSLPENATRFGIQLALDRPFCLGRPRTPDSNQIVSDDFIAGNVIKGLIARLYNDDSALLEQKLCFDPLIITHALPTGKENNQINHPIPLSLAIHNDKVIDLSEQPTENIVWENAPKFSPDWKQEDKKTVLKSLQKEMQPPERLLVLRTEINKKGISEESKLFSLKCIETKKHHWCADIDLHQIPKEKQITVLRELQQKLQHGLYGIGKTKAHAQLTFKLDAPFKAETKQLTPGRQIITLITAARMLPPDLRIPGTNSAEALKKTYQKYWQQALTDEVTLENYFAQQSLTSAYYHQIRNQQTEKAYYPEWLTVAGSVFVLNIFDPDTLKKLQNFAITGLPAHPEVDKTAADWKTTPYLPEQGYGEIQIRSCPQQANEATR